MLLSQKFVIYPEVCQEGKLKSYLLLDSYSYLNTFNAYLHNIAIGD